MGLSEGNFKNEKKPLPNISYGEFNYETQVKKKGACRTHAPISSVSEWNSYPVNFSCAPLQASV